MNALTAIGSNLVYGYISSYILDFVMDDMSDRLMYIMGQLYLMPKEAQRRLIALDLSHKLTTIKTILKDIKGEKYLEPQAEAIAELIHKIFGFIKTIDIKMRRHKEKLLWKWRDPGISTDLDDIELHTSILMDRFSFLRDTMSMRIIP